MSSDKYYVGCTGDVVSERLRRHNSNHSGYTGRSDDWVLKYSEEFRTIKEARQREKEIKRWKSRALIERLTDNSIV